MADKTQKEFIEDFDFDANKIKNSKLSKRDLIKKYNKDSTKDNHNDDDSMVGPSIKKMPKCNILSSILFSICGDTCYLHPTTSV